MFKEKNLEAIIKTMDTNTEYTYKFGLLLSMLQYRGDDTSKLKLNDLVDATNENKAQRFFTDRTEIIIAIRDGGLRDDSNKEFKALIARPDDTFNHYTTIFIVPKPFINLKRKDSELKGKNKALNGNSYIEVVSLDNLIVDISKHKLVPPHRVMSKTEVEAMLDKYDVKGKTYQSRIVKLPSILQTDAMARWIGLRKGEVVEITRAYEGLETFFYRVCI